MTSSFNSKVISHLELFLIMQLLITRIESNKQQLQKFKEKKFKTFEKHFNEHLYYSEAN